MMATPNSTSSRVLILAPHGRDAAVASKLLSQAGLASLICSDVPAFEAALDDETCFAVVTEEALRFADLRKISSFVSRQATWSDLPFIILTLRRGHPEGRLDGTRLSEAFGNVTFLERPFHPMTFLSVARTAHKGRHRQYEARARIEELHESEQRLRTALLAGNLGSWELDLKTGEFTASATCKAHFGRGPNEPFSHQDISDAILEDDRARVLASDRASRESGADYLVEYRIIWPDGGVHWVGMQARLVRDRRGEMPRLVGVSSDITERKNAERNMRHLNETLEERVAERTAALRQAHQDVLREIGQRELAEEQLRQAQKMEVIGQLTGGIAHDFNNLLMAVLSNLELLRKHVGADPKSNRLIAGALQGARRGALLTQRLLAFARRQELHVEPKSVVDLIEGMADLLDRSLGSRIDLELDLPGTRPLVLMDVNQIELALLNLVVNARDAMPDGGSLTIAVDVVEAPKGQDLAADQYVRLIVRDTGHGMDAETLRKATEPFFSTKELGKGTGLGLSMVQGLAVQLNGALRLSSEVDRGTKVELWLPVTELADVALEAAPVVQQEEVSPKITILFVDDDALVAMSTVDMLEDLGHEVIKANSGERALEVLEKGQPVDLLITDYSMPRMTGAQLAKAARDLRPDLPILLATGYAELPPDFDMDLPRLGKPFQQEQLAAEITRILKGGSHGRRSAERR